MTESQFAKNLGVLIREAMKLEKVSAGSLAASLGVHRNSVQRWLTGEHAITAYDLHRVEFLLKSKIEVYEDEVFITQGVSTVVQ